MNNLNIIIAKNIAAARKNSKLTQAELAEKIGYSDKAVSKWERGEGIPDVPTLVKLAEIFGTNIGYFINEEPTQQTIKPHHEHHRAHFIIAVLSVVFVWFIAVVTFVSFGMSGAVSRPWMVYIAAIPVSFIVLLVFNSIWGNITLNLPIMSALIWTAITFTYLMLNNENRWMLFLVGIPLQIGSFLWYALVAPKRIIKKAEKKRLKEQLSENETNVSE